MIGRIIIGIILCVVGYFIVRKPHVILDLAGPIMFAEKWFGNSYSFYKAVGVILILVGFLAITGLHSRFLTWLAQLITV